MCLLPLGVLSSAAHALSASPEALRKEAMRAFEKARSSGEDRREGYLRAERKAMGAVEILLAKPKRTKGEDDLLVELQSLLYWIRKMTPLALGPMVVRRDTNTEPAPPAGSSTPKPPLPAPPPSVAKPRPKGPSRRFPGLPASMEPIARAILQRFERGYTSSAEVDKMTYAYFLRDLRQVYFLRRHPDRPLEAAALIFQAVDEFDLEFTGNTCSVVRMQACLELDRLRRASPGDGLSSRDLRILKKAYGVLATCAYDFDPAVQYFEAVRSAGLTQPDAKLGLALAKLGQGYVVSQARAAPAKVTNFGRHKLGRWFGFGAGKIWVDAYKRHYWSSDRLLKVRDDSQRLFREYAKERPRGDIYRAYSECFWFWYFRKHREFNTNARKAFSQFQARDRTDAEQTMLRIIIVLWMRVNGHVDYDKVKR